MALLLDLDQVDCGWYSTDLDKSGIIDSHLGGAMVGGLLVDFVFGVIILGFLCVWTKDNPSPDLPAWWLNFDSYLQDHMYLLVVVIIIGVILAALVWPLPAVWLLVNKLRKS